MCMCQQQFSCVAVGDRVGSGQEMMHSNNANGATNTTTGSTSTAKMESYANATVTTAVAMQHVVVQVRQDN